MILNRDTMRARGHVVRSRLFARCLILETVDRIDRYNIRDFRALREITRFPGRNVFFLDRLGVDSRVSPLVVCCTRR